MTYNANATVERERMDNFEYVNLVEVGFELVTYISTTSLLSQRESTDLSTSLVSEMEIRQPSLVWFWRMTDSLY